jgi:hypothetical protein
MDALFFIRQSWLQTLDDVGKWHSIISAEIPRLAPVRPEYMRVKLTGIAFNIFLSQSVFRGEMRRIAVDLGIALVFFNPRGYPPNDPYRFTKDVEC